MVSAETGLLRNKVGARTQVALNEAEGDLSFARRLQLMDHPPPATGDLEELRAIHRHLFQDIYEWAGERAEPFLPVSMIPRAAGFAAEELRADNFLRGLDRDRFNYIHSFREGNGRTQRVFWNRVARDAGWQLDWRGVRGVTNDEACRVAAEHRDFRPLQEMFDRIVTSTTLPVDCNGEWHAAERARLSFLEQYPDADADAPNPK